MEEGTELAEVAQNEFKTENTPGDMVWVKRGNNFHLDVSSDHQSELKVGIYKTEFDARAGLYLVLTKDKFDFPYKVYNIEHSFIDRVIKSYNNTTSNMGILLNGIKGTGKTVTAELICNQLNMPVIIVTNNYKGLADLNSFLNNIKQNVVLFFDEYEKMYNDYDYSILTVMDGVLNNGFRKVFLLTTNKTYINENMLQRPSRIRYLKTFGDLPLKAIIEIVNDKLEHPQFKDAVIAFISKLEIITVDIVKSIVEEVNIHEEEPSGFSEIFNVQPSVVKYNVLRFDSRSKSWRGAFEKVVVDKYPFSEESLNADFQINGRSVGQIMGLEEDFTVVTVDPEYCGDAKKFTKFKIEKATRDVHKSFSNYSLIF